METQVQRRVITIRGIVQGVGFRPFVYHLAREHRLQGFVRNRDDEVHIEVQGNAGSLERFLEKVTSSPPPLARIASVSWSNCAPGNEQNFRICESETAERASTFLSPDIATCEECLKELFDPADRRYLYPFINCTNCGPRFTIISGLPYDRAQTTMAPFQMCAECRAEYENPENRRFHAQATACPRCGPRVEVRSADGSAVETREPITTAAEAILAGRIIAFKGLGGFHLVCDATNEQAVSELRRRKRRDEKPFAIMAADVRAAELLCRIHPMDKELLESPERPIVLLRRTGSGNIAGGVAAHNPYLGVMLPYTPLHVLLVGAAKGVPLVMTSGNATDEPMVFEDEEAAGRLGDIADLFLTHNRGIHFRCDDSVISRVGKYPIVIRRSRGYAPASLTLRVKTKCPVLALGGQQKATFALGRGTDAILSHHLGDLDHYPAWAEYERSVDHYRSVFDFEAEIFAHDLHPDYATTRYAEERAGGAECRIATQHHHAHMASCMAEHGLAEPVIGVTFDGTGYGTDETIWGGEFLVGDYDQFHRGGHLRCVRMPGGERAVLQPWRMALAHLLDASLDPGDLLKDICPETLATVIRSLRHNINAPWTSSCGRLFDAAAAIIGIRSAAFYEGQAAIELEWAATGVAPDGSYPFVLEAGDPAVVDTRPFISALAEDVRRGAPRPVLARRVHSTLAEIIVAVCLSLRGKFGLDKVVFSGGVFMNRILLEEARAALEKHHFEVFSHRQVPPNDGGLCLGQLAIAAAKIG